MSYLKALGVFRLVAEQADPTARLSWAGGVARLGSHLDRGELLAFFLERYRPTPITAPWGGGSGFYGGGSEPLEAIARSAAGRLDRYRETIALIRTLAPCAKPKDEQKKSLLIRCRAELPDEVVPWLDACYVLGDVGPGYPPLLGTGANDGRLDFTNNFMQRLAEVIPFADGAATPAGSEPWLAAALFADTLTELRRSAIGQFHPGGVGGPNGVQGKFEADSRVNAWDFVLMIEGTLLFAGAVARRLGTNATTRAAFPFTVDSVAVGYGSAVAGEETTDGSRAELWLPLWSGPMILAEVEHLFAEGRAQLGRRQAKNAVEFALAVNLLGVHRGVGAFARYGFLKRNGLSFLAAPLGRVAVTTRPQARLLDDPKLVEWLERLRRACRDKDKTPARYQAALRQIDRALYEFANRSERENDRKYLLEVLRALGRAERTLARGLVFCKDKGIWPLQGLGPDWLDQADDGRPEFGLAASLAGIRPSGAVGLMRAFLEEVEGTKSVAWSPGSTSAVWSERPLSVNLAAIFRRRLLEAYRDMQEGVPLDAPRPARPADVALFLRGEVDEAKLADLLWCLAAVDWSSVTERPPAADDAAVPFAFGVPRLLVEQMTFSADRDVWRLNVRGAYETRPDPEVFDILASGQADAVERGVDRAARRLKSGGLLVHGYRNRRLAGRSLAVGSSIPADRLLAAMLFPLSKRDLEAVANRVLYPPEVEE